MPRVMLIIATGQNAANIQPLSEASLRPDSVCIAVTHTMQSHYEGLKAQINSMGIKTEAPLQLQQELDVKQLELCFSEWLLEQHTDDEVLVNLAGGLKTITIAAYKAFSALGAKIFYAHHDGQIIWVDEPLNHALHLKPNIGLPAYLKIYQYELVSRLKLADIDKKYRDYAQHIKTYLGHHFHERCKALSHLNWLAQPVVQAINKFERDRIYKGKKLLPESSLQLAKPAPSSQLDELYLATPYIELLFSLSPQQLVFKDMLAAKVAGGGWLDILVADTLRQLPSTMAVRDISLNVSFAKSTQRSGQSSHNELDVIALAGTRLLIVECKTINWMGNTEASPLEAIYKLAALKDIGGLNTHTLFVSLYDLPDHAKTRAAESYITVISGQRLLELPSLLAAWIAD